jgi:glycosyltransferase involved in cell wall biosynthesis
MPYLSIIVPVYNVEAYLRRCIDSILAQSFTGYECILIDDGSTDNCPAICDEYAVKDSRIIVIRQKNGGRSVARNAGLDIARGEWISFVDGDDYLEPGAVECLSKKQRETGADIVIGSYNLIYDDESGGKYKEKKRFSNYSITGKQAMIKNFFRLSKTNWGKLYRASVCGGIRFSPELINGEDQFFNIQVFYLPDCKKITVIDDIVYNWDRTTGGISATRLCGESVAFNSFIAFIYIKQFLQKKSAFDFEIKCLYYKYLFGVIYPRMYFNIEKKKVISIISANKLAFFYFPVSFSMFINNIFNLLFLINAGLCKKAILQKSKLSRFLHKKGLLH